MALSGYIPSSDGDRYWTGSAKNYAYFRIYWEVTQTTQAGNSTIQFTPQLMFTQGGWTSYNSNTSGAYAATGQYYIDNSGQGSFTGTFASPNGNGAEWPKNNWYTLPNFQRSYTISGHTSDRTINVRMEMSTHTGGLADITSSTFTNKSITVSPRMSACGAPTSITASGIVTPSGSFTVSWSGATSGTANTINGYDIYYKVSSNGAAPTTSDTGKVSVSSTSTSGSTTISLSSATRGYKVVCGVVTKGSGGSSWYSPIATGGLVTINSLPNKPTVTPSRTVVPSSGGSVTFTLSATDADGQTLTYAYATSSTGTKTTIASGGSITVSSTSTYYFWSKDSLNEYSSTPTSVTITKNTAPTITSSTFTPTTYLAQNSTTSFASSVAVTATCSKTGTMTIEVLYGASSSPTTIGYTATKSITSTSSQTIGTYNINSILKDKYTGSQLYFRIRLTISDGLDSTTSTTQGVYLSQSWSIASTPSTAATFDNFLTSGTSDPTNTVANNCWNKVCIKYYEDASMTSYTVSATATKNNVTTNLNPVTLTSTYKPSSGSNANYRYLNVTLPSDIEGGSTITITVNLSDGNITKTFIATITELGIPALGTLNINISTIKMYETTSNIQLTCNAPCKFEDNAPVSAASYYIQSMSVDVAGSTSGENGRNNLTIASATATAAGSTLTVQITKANFVNFGDFGKTAYNGTAIGYVKIDFVNIYGRTISTGYKSYTIDYNRDPSITSLTMVYGSSNTTVTKIQETLVVKGKIVCVAYTNSTLTAKLYYKIGNGSWNLVNTTTKVVSNGQSSQTLTFYTSDFTIPEISTDNSWTWRIVLTNNITSTAPEKSTSAITAVKHIAPTITLTKVEGTPTPASGTRTGINLKPTFTIEDNILNQSSKTITYYIVNGSDDTVISSSFTASGTSVADTSSDKATWTQKSVRIKCVTTATGQTTTTKTGYSNQFTVYLDSPTIAYRKNHLGINTANPNANAVVDIYSQSGGLQYINLHNVSGGMIQIDLLNSTIDII
jgi:hypothetical protein